MTRALGTRSFVVSGNPLLSGTIPAVLFRSASQLAVIDFSNNFFQGSLPLTITGPTTLQYVPVLDLRELLGFDSDCAPSGAVTAQMS